MIIPHLHFCGDCEEAITLYEKAFHTKSGTIIRYQNDAPEDSPNDKGIAHAVMNIHGQQVFLNDRFGNKERSMDCAIHLIVY